MSPDFLRFVDLVHLYWRERGDRTLNEAWHAWRSEDGLCPPLKTPEHAAAKAALIEEWGAEKFETIADLYDQYG